MSSIIGLTQKDDDGEGSVGHTEEDVKTKWEKTAKKSQEILRNAERLDQEETWRLTNEGVLIKAQDGNFYELSRLTKNQLQAALKSEKFDGIKDFIEKEIAKK